MNPQPRPAAPEPNGRTITPKPHSNEAEQAALGACLLDPTVLSEVRARLKPDDFFQPVNATIFHAILALHADGKPVDYITVLDAVAQLRRANRSKPEREQIELVDVELEYLARLTEVCWASANVLFYVDQIRAAAEARTIMRLGQTAHAIAAQSNPGDALSVVKDAVREIEARRVDDRGQPIRDVVKAIHRRWDDAGEGKSTTGISTGFSALDAMIGGHRAGELTILGGRPSAGKTSFACALAYHAAAILGAATLFVSTEVGSMSIGETMLGAFGQVNTRRLKSGNASKEEFASIVRVSGELANADLVIDESKRVTVESIALSVERHKPKLLVVDYLQHLKGSGRNPRAKRYEEVTEITVDLKNLATAAGIPVIALAALNRPEKGKPRRPRMSDLRESGGIEFEADTVLLLWRPCKDGVHAAAPTLAECVVEKQREGPIGPIELRFVEEYRRFEDAPIQRDMFAPITPAPI